MRTSACLAVLVSAAISAAAPAAVIYDDHFTTAPASNGYFVYTPSANALVNHAGSEVTFTRGNSVAQETSYIQKVISIAGYSSITGTLLGSRSGGLESDDRLDFFINYGSPSSEQAIVSRNDDVLGTPFTLGPAAVPSAPSGAGALVRIRVAGNVNASNNAEFWNVDRITLEGTISGPTAAAVQVSDEDFSDISDWTASTPANFTLASNGTQAVFGRSTTTTTESNSATLTRTFDFSNYDNLALDLRGLAFNTDSGADFFRVEIDTGSGFTTLYQTSVTTTVAGGAFFENFVQLPDAADGNANVQIRLSATMNAADETYRLDNLTIWGLESAVEIPEPASLSVLGLGAALLLLRRRRR